MLPHPWSGAWSLSCTYNWVDLCSIKPAASEWLQMLEEMWALGLHAHQPYFFCCYVGFFTWMMWKILHLDQILLWILVLARTPTHHVTTALSSERCQYNGALCSRYIYPLKSLIFWNSFCSFPAGTYILHLIPSESRSQLPVMGKAISQTGMFLQAYNNSFNKRFWEMVPLNQGYGL